jgi:xanthine dehydrogenase accessory factor
VSGEDRVFAVRSPGGEPMTSREEWVTSSELRGPSFRETSPPPPRLILVGAVALAAELCTLARTIGWRTVLIDPRPHFATAERFPNAAEILVQWPQHAFSQLGLDGECAVVMLAHDPVLDDPALELALRSPAFFVGAMGSRRTQAARRERLAAAGLCAAELARLSGPLGLDLGALTVQETALSALAEIVAVMHGREGGRLAVAEGSIHEGRGR